MASGKTRLSGELTGLTAPGNRPECWFEPGLVTTAVAGYGGDMLLTVLWRGAKVPAGYVTTYTPQEGDVVLLVIQPPGKPIALGRLSTNAEEA